MQQSCPFLGVGASQVDRCQYLRASEPAVQSRIQLSTVATTVSDQSRARVGGEEGRPSSPLGRNWRWTSGGSVGGEEGGHTPVPPQDQEAAEHGYGATARQHAQAAVDAQLLVAHPHVLLVRLGSHPLPDGLQLCRGGSAVYLVQGRVPQVIPSPLQEPPQVLLADGPCTAPKQSSLKSKPSAGRCQSACRGFIGCPPFY
jgi:hypothetical protein